MHLFTDIEQYIGQSADNPTAFNTLALRLFARQYESNLPYRNFCDGRGQTPQNTSDWSEIPPAPANAFKHFSLTCAAPDNCTIERGGRIFQSSGTTQRETSRHFMDANALDLYRISLRAGYRRFVEPDNRMLPILALMPPPNIAPQSSLSFMADDLIAVRGGNFFHDGDWQAAFAECLESLTVPHALFGTAFAWVLFFDAVDTNFTLPAGSVVIETGGFKGRSREIGRDELYGLFNQRLGIPDSHCIAEYGMSEMASQFYDSTLHNNSLQIDRPRRKIAPPWLKTRVVNPLTGNLCASGESGLFAHYDLANINSVFAIQTEDWGYALPEGTFGLPDGGFVLLGRAPGAVLRGCSLLAEELMGETDS